MRPKLSCTSSARYGLPRARPYPLGPSPATATRARSAAISSPWNGPRSPENSKSFPRSIAQSGFRCRRPTRRFIPRNASSWIVWCKCLPGAKPDDAPFRH